MMSDETSCEAGQQRCYEVKARVQAAALEAGRAATDVHLIAVSKTFDAGAIKPVLAAGARAFGENRVQEALHKWPGLLEAYPDTVLHLIGPLQTNKVKEAVRFFRVIHTLDRPKLAEKLANELAKTGVQRQFFIQVNTGEEPQKAGILPTEADAFIAFCRDQCGLPVQGLMCIPPVNDTAALHFMLLKKIAQRNGLAQLSMGMSADFETAIAYGATHIRVGSAIFGGR